MDFSDKIARYEEIERRGLLSQLPQEKQDMWAEYKRRQAKDSAVNNDAENNGKQSYLEQMAGKVATLDRGLTFGLGRKALGAAWAAGAKLGDTLAGNDNAPDFWGRYHEFVDPVVEAQQQYAEEHPAEALTAEIAASIANPANKVGASYIGKGKSLADVAARASAVGGGIGGVAGAMNTEYAKDLFPNTAAGVGVGAAMGGILPVAANRASAVYNAGKRIFMPEASVAGKETGLGNVVKDNDSVRSLTRGIMASDDVANQVLKEAPSEMGRLNEELTDILNKTTGRKLNIEGAKQNADEAYKSYVAANADYPVFNTKTAEEQAQQNFNRWFEGSKVVDENGQPLKLYHGTDANFDVFSSEKLGKNTGVGTAFNFTDSPETARTYGNKVLETYLNMQNPITVDFGDRSATYFLGKLRNPQEITDEVKNIISDMKNHYNIDENIIEELKNLGYREYSDNLDGIIFKNVSDNYGLGGNSANNYVVFEPNQIKSVNNSGAWSSSPSLSDAGWKPQPSLKDVVGQLNEYKQNAMNKALAEGAAMSDYGAGSLDAVHKAQGVLNDMIENSFDKSVLGVKRPTTQTAELTSLKQVFNNMLEPSGVKPLDARIAKAKSLQYFYDMGYKFKPSEKKFEDLGIKTLRDKRAFLQGRLQAILDNVKDDKNLAKAIRADENTLKKLMPAKRFDELLSKTSEIDRQYTRLNKYIQLANRELDKPLAADRPMSERGETWSSYLSSLYDKANARMWQNANSRRAQALLNGGAQNPEVLAALERLAGRYNLGQITPYIAQLAAQNQ
jgi:hypothetical protein